MLGRRIVIKRGDGDVAEKPFWISFADMMTALMVLFLVVMCVALLAIVKEQEKVLEKEKSEEQKHSEDVNEFLQKLEEKAKGGITIDKNRNVINFGDKALFEDGKWSLKAEQEEFIRQFVPEILTLANSELGKRVLKRVVVEGYTSKKGTYLFNLNLSLQRSQKVLCTMFANEGGSLLNIQDKKDVRDLFSVGGYSFNNSKHENNNDVEQSNQGSDDDNNNHADKMNRRVEMRLEILGVGELRPELQQESGDVELVDNLGVCALR